MYDLKLKNTLLIQKIFGAGSLTAFSVFSKITDSNMLNKPIDIIATNVKFTDSIKAKLLAAEYSLIEKILTDTLKNDIDIIPYYSEKYPDNLRHIDTPPIILFAKGNFPDFNKLPSITIVGPRKATEFGLKAAYSLGFRIARSGIVVVSGGALGCDKYAHIGALDSQGTTVAVLGCGICADYLTKNKPLRDKISENGCLVSEYPPFTPATKFTFPVRNRIMSGISLGTVVVEAPQKSGSLITARNAAEQGRDVFVIPGNPTLKEYKGSNALLRDGAKPLIDASDIFNEYIFKYPEYIDIEKAFLPIKNEDKSIKTQKNSEISKESLSNEAKIVYNNLDNQLFSFDDLSNINLSSEDILSALTELELENFITPLPGGKYKLI